MGGGPVDRQVTVAVVDDHPVVLEGVDSWVRRDSLRRVRIVAAGAMVDEVLDPAMPAADVVVLDLELERGFAIDDVTRLANAGRRVIVFSQHTDNNLVLRAMDAGAVAYLTKKEGARHLVEAVVTAAANKPYVTPSQAGVMAADHRRNAPALTDRERDALRLWFQGMSKASVGRRMDISEHTVKDHINRAWAKYAATGRQVPTKEAFLARAVEDGLIRLDEIKGYQSFAARREAE